MTAHPPSLPLLKLCPLGLGERLHHNLSVFVEQQLHDVCTLATEPVADALLVDGDAPQATLFIHQQQQHRPQRPLIVLTHSPLSQASPQLIPLLKPVRTEALAEILKSVRERLFAAHRTFQFKVASDQVLLRSKRKQNALKAAKSLPGHPRYADNNAPSGHIGAQGLNIREKHFYIGSMPDADLHDPTALEKARFNPEQYLIGFVLRAAKSGIEQASVVRLISSIFGMIEIYPFARKVLTQAKPSVIYAAGRLPLMESDIRIELLSEAKHHPGLHAHTEDLDAFLWKLALWASRGRLPSYCDPFQPVQLKRWPNLTRLLVPPHASRIAGLWSKGALSPAQSAEMLAIPQRYVFSFYSACRVLDLFIAPSMPIKPPPPSVEIPDQTRRPFLRMLLHKLIGQREN